MSRRILLAACLFTLVLGACAPAVIPAPTSVPPTNAPTRVPPTPPPTAASLPPTTAPIVLTDALGRPVTLAAPAQRVVSLAASNTEIVFALGAGGQLVARDEFSDYPPEALAVTSIGSLYPKVNAEAILALQPDLVLAAGITNPDDVRALADLGLTVYATSVAATLDDIFGDILAVGALTGRGPQAETLVAGLKQRVAAVQTTAAGAASKPKVFYEIDATDPAKPWTAGAGSFIDQLLAMAGGTNVGALMQESYAQIGVETLVAEDPALIILGSASYGGQTPELVAARPGWNTLSAVKNQAVYVFDDNLVSRPGPRVVDGLEALAKLIHPELFK